jgi:hypothetical protein
MERHQVRYSSPFLHRHPGLNWLTDNLSLGHTCVFWVTVKERWNPFGTPGIVFLSLSSSSSWAKLAYRQPLIRSARAHLCLLGHGQRTLEPSRDIQYSSPFLHCHPGLNWLTDKFARLGHIFVLWVTAKERWIPLWRTFVFIYDQF